MFLQHIPIGLLLMWQLVEWSSVSGSPTTIHKRQVSLDDLIHTALKIVQPIFDTSQPLLENNQMIPKRITADQQSPSLGLRESSILGAPTYSALRDVPICRGNSQICRFISCTAHNFKHDQNFANLNLAAQLIGDQKFRKTISSNPEAIHTVCQEQGLSSEQCRLFSRGFQLIDRFMGTIEKPASHSQDSQLNPEDAVKPPSPPPKAHLQQTPSVESLLSQPLNDMPDPPPPLRPIQPVNQLALGGSRTWSTHRNADLEPASKQIYTTSPKVVTYEEPTMRRPPKRGVGTTAPRASAPALVQLPSPTTISRPYSTQTAKERVPRARSSIPEAEDYDVECSDCDYGRQKRAAGSGGDYYDLVEPTQETVRNSSRKGDDGKSANKAGKPGGFTKMNCFQYLG